MTSLLFIGFHFLLYFIGRGFSIGLNRFLKFEYELENKYIGNIKIHYFYPVVALFIIGNLTVVLNFFSGTNNFILFLITLAIFSMNFLKLKMSFDKESIIYFVAIPLILSISSYGINLAQDAGLYHLNTQGWIREEKINLGLHNIHSRYGYSSLYDYIASNFWWEQNYILIHFVNLTFIVLFFIFLYSNLFLSKNYYLKNLSLLVLIFGVLDNFGFSGGRNGFIDIEAVTKYDTPFAILYFITGSLIINALITDDYDNFQLATILYLLLFSIQLRIFAISLVPLFIFFLSKFLTKYNLKNTLKLFYPPLCLGLVWVIKNVLISSCLFFPVEQTCFDFLAWSDVGSAALESKDLNVFHISYSFDQNLNIWFNNWLSKDINYSTLLNYIISLTILFIFNSVMYKKSSLSINRYTRISIIFGLIIPLVIWLLSAPGIRFGLGLFLLSISLFSINYHDSSERFKIYLRFKKITYIFIFTVSILLIIRIDTYTSFFDNFNNTIELNPTNINYVDNSLGWGVIPEEGNTSCWVNIECLPNSKNIKKIDGVYNYFVNLNY